MNKDLRDPFASFRTRVSDALMPTKRVKFPRSFPLRLRSGSGFRQRAPASLTPAKRLKLSKSTRQIRLAASGSVLGDGHTSALTHRSIPLSPMCGYVSVTGSIDVCDENLRDQVRLVIAGLVG